MEPHLPIPEVKKKTKTKNPAHQLDELEEQKAGLHTKAPTSPPRGDGHETLSGFTRSCANGPTPGWTGRVTPVIMPHAYLQKLMSDSEMPPNQRTPLPGLPKHSSSRGSMELNQAIMSSSSAQAQA